MTLFGFIFIVLCKSFAGKLPQFPISKAGSSARDVALAFGMPPMILNIPGDNTYSNYQEARAALYEDTIIPLHDSLRDDLNNWIVPAFGEGFRLDSDKDAIHALAPRRQAMWDKVRQADWLTINEKRVATGYDEIESENVILVGSTEIPLEDAISGPSVDLLWIRRWMMRIQN